MKLYPAYLWIGSDFTIKKETEKFLKDNLCQNKSRCNSCTDCKKIDLKQHYLVRWLEPENQYTTAQLEIIFKTILFTLDPEQNFFFILNRADLLSTICANSLLKSLEEPPAGYHFILTAQNQDGILPTISSRCIIKHFSSLQDDLDENYNLLISYFTGLNKSKSDFLKDLDKYKPLERDIPEFIDKVYSYWISFLKSSITDKSNKINKDNTSKAESIINTLDYYRNFLPMPGSSKIFLKNLFLQIVDKI